MKEVARTFDEDKVILEAQQARLRSAHFDTFPRDLRADAGTVQARLMMAPLLAEQEQRETLTGATAQREPV